MSKLTRGSLYVVATPIGHLGDISRRACETLAAVDLIAAEDTRHSKKLLDHLGIRKPMLALHEHNEASQAEKIVSRLQDGESVALISDAGTPLISDPGQRLIAAVNLQGLNISPIPGACAAIAALSASGLLTERWCFEGFLPAKATARRKQLELLSTETRSLVFYEAPHRIINCIADMQSSFGADRQATIARELTKRHEQICTGSLAVLAEKLASDAIPARGEFVVIVSGSNESAPETIGINVDKLLERLVNEMPLKQAVKITAEISGHNKNLLYQQALELKAD